MTNDTGTRSAWEDRFRSKLEAFLNTPYTFNARQWIYTGPVSAYLRAGPRPSPRSDTMEQIVTLATVEISEKSRGKGFLWTLLSIIEDESKKAGFAGLVLENVSPKWLADAYRKRGYENHNLIPPDGMTETLYKDL